MAATDTPTGKLDSAATASAPVPKRIVNAQTVCNQKNEKGKLCNGHLKQLGTAGEPAQVHLRGDDVLSKCQTCGTLYMGPPLGHVRDPNKQHRFVEAELQALLQAAGGTLPVIKKDERGVYTTVDIPGAIFTLASGINNTVSRVAGLLAVAVFGTLMNVVFQGSLERRLDHLALPSAVRTEITAQRAKLAATETRDPRGRTAIQESFVDGYRVVLWVAVALALASSLSGAVMISTEKRS